MLLSGFGMLETCLLANDLLMTPYDEHTERFAGPLSVHLLVSAWRFASRLLLFMLRIPLAAFSLGSLSNASVLYWCESSHLLERGGESECDEPERQSSKGRTTARNTICNIDRDHQLRS